MFVNKLLLGPSKVTWSTEKRIFTLKNTLPLFKVFKREARGRLLMIHAPQMILTLPDPNLNSYPNPDPSPNSKDPNISSSDSNLKTTPSFDKFNYFS